MLASIRRNKIVDYVLFRLMVLQLLSLVVIYIGTQVLDDKRRLYGLSAEVAMFIFATAALLTFVSSLYQDDPMLVTVLLVVAGQLSLPMLFLMFREARVNLYEANAAGLMVLLCTWTLHKLGVVRGTDKGHLKVLQGCVALCLASACIVWLHAHWIGTQTWSNAALLISLASAYSFFMTWRTLTLPDRCGPDDTICVRRGTISLWLWLVQKAKSALG